MPELHRTSTTITQPPGLYLAINADRHIFNYCQAEEMKELLSKNLILFWSKIKNVSGLF